MKIASTIFLFLSISQVFSQVARFGISKRFEKNKNNHLNKRDTNTVKFIDDTIAYYVNITVGSQGQQILALLDTGSSDLWFPGPENKECKDGKPSGPRFVDSPDLSSPETDAKQSSIAEFANEIQNYCSSSNVFNYHESDTWHSNNSEFKISYLDGSISTGLWGYDDVEIDGISISNFSFAVTNSSNASAILGIGFDKSETTYIMNDNPYTYSNFPLRLKEDGYIEKIAYSLSTGDDFNGSLLVGGVDHSKYSGDLITVPIISDFNSQITLSGLGLKNDDDDIETISSTFYPTLLDSGTTTANFPHQLLDPLAERLGSTLEIIKHDSYEYYDVDCNYLSKDNFTIEFDFSGKIISVPLTNIIDQNNETCFLKIVSLTDDIVILGDIFLSSIYVVYDLEDKEISLAQINPNPNHEERIEPVISSVPSATKAPNYSSTWTTQNLETTTLDVFSTILI